MPSKKDLNNFLIFSQNLAHNVGKILLKEQYKVKIIKYKDRKDIATTADLASEEYVISEIIKNFPNHNISSEEKGNIENESAYLWIIDPLDGTKEYIRGIPLWNFSMALEYKGELITSVVYRPYEDSMYSAIKSKSFLNGKQIKVSSVNNLEDAFVYCYLPSYLRNKENYDNSFRQLSEVGKAAYRLRGLSDENSALCWLAHGGIEAYINLSNPPKWHDIAPGILIAQGAGAYVYDRSGNNFNKNNFNGIIVVNNINILSGILKVINPTWGVE
jgi:myo-inositol-1(or 4)-monophosphatase